MKITKNESKIILEILKSPKKDYNANNLSKIVGITSMGVLKILKRLEKEEILISKKVGKASIYSINFNKKYAIDYIEFLLKREAENSSPYAKRWINEIRKIDKAKIAILFGSVLNKKEKSKDIDVLFITEKENFDSLRKKLDKINQLNEKKIHAVYQTKEDLRKNISNQDKVLLNAIKGIVVFGEKKFISLIKETK